MRKYNALVTCIYKASVGEQQCLPAMMTNFFAASATTFSWNWHAPPPLIAFRHSSTSSAPSIVTSISGYLCGGRDVSKNRVCVCLFIQIDSLFHGSHNQPSFNDKELALETCWNIDNVLKFRTLQDTLHSIDNG